MADASFIEELRQRKELLEGFSREVNEIFRLLNKTIAQEFQEMLDKLLNQDVQQFRSLLLQSLGEGVGGLADSGVASGLAQARRENSLRISAGQASADLLGILQRAQRNS